MTDRGIMAWKYAPNVNATSSGCPGPNICGTLETRFGATGARETHSISPYPNPYVNTVGRIPGNGGAHGATPVCGV